MNSELKRKAYISIAIHAALLLMLIVRSFISCHRVDTRNISPFLDVQMGGGGAPWGGGAAAAAAAADKKPDDSFPELVKKTKATEGDKKKLVKKPAPSTRRALSESELKKMLSAGLPGTVSSAPGPGAGPGSGGGGVYSPFASYYNQIRAAMYEAWQQPSSLTGRKGMIVTVEIRVQRDGRITSKKIISSSGNTQMDDSVARALEAVTRLPELPAGMGGFYKDIIIDFELTDMALPDGG